MDCNSTGKINASTKKTWSFSRSALLQITVLCILLVIIIVLFILVIQKTADTMNKSKTNYQGLCNINGTSDDCIHDLNYQLQECKSDMNKAQQDCKINGCDGHDILKDHLKKTCRKEWSTGEMNCSFCPTGWLQNFRKCYFISKENKTWLECRNICISHKADLVIVKEKNELEYLQYIMNDANGFYWIGLRRDSSEIWRWVDGSPFDGSLFQNVTRHGGTHVFISKKTTSSGLHYTKKMCICQRSSVMV
ncbi:killer cell lectin-like receptor subfamily B member 1B allele B [Polypterus senegalus]|uniref:killer cell lectin-like receptor subfamily B member 1B allele B n=1 Tax=Polypterus senegalus TaxID=55291 RepID=UPI0019652486|nr:killer cell lectin-like receptor subfamily B member 1B allele B [Polypterus senegalus]